MSNKRASSALDDDVDCLSDGNSYVYPDKEDYEDPTTGIPNLWCAVQNSSSSP